MSSFALLLPILSRMAAAIDSSSTPRRRDRRLRQAG